MENRRARRQAAAAAKRSGGGSGRPPTAGPQSTNPKDGSPEAVEPEALAVSHVFDSGETGEPYTAIVRLTGRRAGIVGQPGARDTFVQEDAFEGIVPGSGPVSVSSWVYGLEPGEWTVKAELLGRENDGRGGRRGAAAEPIQPAEWSWLRRTVKPGSRGSVRTRWAVLAPMATAPGVVPGSFTVLAVAAIVVALVTQSTILAPDAALGGRALGISLVATLAGLVGAKLWYAILRPGPWRQAMVGGWAVDGFLVSAPAVAIAILLVNGLPVGRFLDATAPGIFFAVAIGRLGCFFTGCCAGRCTTSRWGIWSSDRRIGARRIPTQLLESGAGLAIGIAAWMLVDGSVLPIEGGAFALGIGAYFLIRQGLLRLRAERRDYLWRRSALVTGTKA